MEEFKQDPDCFIIFSSNNLDLGRTIAEDKAKYCKENQGDLIIFNANIITKKNGKIWYGDLNINVDFDNLKNVADQINQDLYILMEGDARFGYEKQPIKSLIEKAKVTIKCNKNETKKRKKNGTSDNSTT